MTRSTNKENFASSFKFSFNFGICRANNALNIFTVAEAPKLINVIHRKMSDFESSGGSFSTPKLFTAQITCAKNNTTVSNHDLCKGGKGTARSTFSKHLLIIMLN